MECISEYILGKFLHPPLDQVRVGREWSPENKKDVRKHAQNYTHTMMNLSFARKCSVEK